LMVYFFDDWGLGWQYQMAAMLIPTLIYGFMFFRQKFPKTERVLAGISTKDMYKACLTPLFLFMAFCMLLTAGTEFATNQWVAELLANVGVHAILLLVWISGIMAVGRSVAGPIVHRFSPSGVLWGSAILAFVGILLMSKSSGLWSFGAAAIFALGITYFWPTMLGFISENIPKSGALGLAVFGGLGFLAGAIVQPAVGTIFDAQIATAIPEGYTLEVLQSAAEGTKEAGLLALAELTAGKITLGKSAVLPAVLILAFGFLFFTRKKREVQKLDFNID
ncbi:sugar MFS transporter, partial [Bacteroidota bacterium]